ncbi:MAG: hypothetical protein J1F71_06005 [Clostridiales bacterium]|nr:hypothetical protein [Clostridiales bacterium]
MSDKTKTNDGRDKLADEIDRLEQTSSGAMKPSLPKTTLEEKKYDAPSDDTLKKTAESELADYKRNNENSLKQKSAAEEEELNSKRDTYEQARERAGEELEKSYEAATRALDNDVVRRGLARSSIAAVERGALEREFLGKNAEIIREYTNNIAKLETDIAAVNKKLQEALNDFNLTYASKLTARLNELKTEREKKMQEVIEYNNEIKRKQADLDNDRLLTESKLYSEALAQEKQEKSLDGVPADRKDEIYRAVYKKMDEFLGSLDPSDALLEIRNHSMYRQHLSNYYYSKLYDKYGREVI